MSEPIQAAAIPSYAGLAAKTVPAPRRPALLISPAVDAALIGGAALFVFVLLRVFVPRTAEWGNVSSLTFQLSFLVNLPHFALSYQLLYWDRRRELLRTPRFLWAALLAPLLIGGVLAYGVVAAREAVLGYSAWCMYLLVGWHYVKQTYGIVCGVAGRESFALSGRERLLLRYTALSVWLLSFVEGNHSGALRELYGIHWQALALPEVFVQGAEVVAGAMGIWALGHFVVRYARTGTRPPTGAMLAAAALYSWYIPVFSHNAYFLLIPFFHSLQYLVFALGFKKQRLRSTPAEAGSSPTLQLCAYMLLAILLGGAFFYFIPTAIDQLRVASGAPKAHLAMFLFTVALNIHHYVIDNVIWRRKQEGVGTILFRSA